MMKRIICIIMVLAFALGFSACHAQEETLESTGVSHTTSGMHPRMLLVYSPEALTRLVNAAKLSDAEFAEFVAQVSEDPDDQISIASNTKKQEVESLVQFLKSGIVPVLNSNVIPEDYCFEYRPFESFIVIDYIINGVRYVFLSARNEGGDFCYKGKQEGFLAIEEDRISLHREGKRLKGFLYKGNYSLDVQISAYSEGKENSIAVQTIAPIEFVWSNATGEVE